MPGQLVGNHASRRFQVGLERSHNSFVLVCEERRCKTILSGTTCSPNAVGIRIDASRRKIVVDDVSNVGNIETTSRHIGCHQNDPTLLEDREVLFTLVLRLATVQNDTASPEAFDGTTNPIGVFFLVDEDKNLFAEEARVLDKPSQGIFLLRGTSQVQNLLDNSDVVSRILVTDANYSGMAKIPFGHLLDFRWHCRRKHGRDSMFGQLVDCLPPVGCFHFFHIGLFLFVSFSFVFGL
mmetsp:Transcript_5553/g.11483  ORF Transcript_5553/g.11483 Transcript_5553/m.11483 type:complete len:237 (+) Transcript_5553:219-929(+)